MWRYNFGQQQRRGLPPKPFFRPLRYPDTKARGLRGSALFVSLGYSSPHVRKANEGSLGCLRAPQTGNLSFCRASSQRERKLKRKATNWKRCSRPKRSLLAWGLSLRNNSLLFNPQLQRVKLRLGHALQGHCCGQIQSGNVLDLAAAFYLATELLYCRVSTHVQKHFIRIGDRQRLFNQAMLNQDAMIRRYCQRRWDRRDALALFWVFHCPFSLEPMIALRQSRMNRQRALPLSFG